MTCGHMHEEIAFTKFALDRYRRFVQSQPCHRGLACRPDGGEKCKLKHMCPWGTKCVFAPRQACVFDANLFQGQGHKPNVASNLYGERCVPEGVADASILASGNSGNCPFNHGRLPC